MITAVRLDEPTPVPVVVKKARKRWTNREIATALTDLLRNKNYSFLFEGPLGQMCHETVVRAIYTLEKDPKAENTFWATFLKLIRYPGF